MWSLVFFLSLALGDSAHLVALGEDLCPFQLKGGEKNQMILGVNISISLPVKSLPSVFPRRLCLTSWTHLCIWDTTDRTETWQGGLPCAFSRK